MIYSAALHDDTTGALVVEGLTNGQRMPLWSFAEGISDSGQQTLLHVIDTCWREIGGHLGDGTGQIVPPQVTSTARKPLSIAFEEIAADKIEGISVDLAAETSDLAELVGDGATDGD